MKHRLFLHIGMPKTGTSSLQKFLAFNNEALKKYGWNYPNARGNFENEDIDEPDRYKNDGYWPYVRACCLGKKNWQSALDFFHEKLENSLKLYNTILSDESIWIERAKEYIEYLKKEYPNIVLVVYLRRQDFAMESWYSEIVRGQNVSDSFSKWYEQKKIKEENGRLFFKYYDSLVMFEEIVGKENIIVRPYVEEKGFDLNKDFLSVIGLNEKYDEFHGIERINRSMSILDTEVKRKMNEMLEDQPAYVAAVLHREYQNVYESTERPMSPFRFDREERKRILEHYSVQNEKVSERYRNGEKLFNDIVDFEPASIDPYETEVCYVRLLEKLLLRVLYRNMYPSLMSALAQGKKIAVFGAGFMGRQMVEKKRVPVDIIIDNNETLAGQSIREIKIVTPKDVSDWGKYFVIISVKDALEIEKQLESLGLKKDVDFVLMSEMLSVRYM